MGPDYPSRTVLYRLPPLSAERHDASVIAYAACLVLLPELTRTRSGNAVSQTFVTGLFDYSLRFGGRGADGGVA
jgi:hypothetical protein